jgi:TPR repeat protein
MSKNRWIFVVIVFIVLQAVPAHADGSRVALVIGNGAYRLNRLQNPVNDAEAVTAAFRRLGFQVIYGADLDRRAMAAMVQRFARAAEGADIAAVFYAGHGVQVSGRNWLLAVDDALNIEQETRSDVVTADILLDASKGAKRLRLIILDSCRNFALASGSGPRPGSVRSGLAKINLESFSNSLVIYATRAGETAPDGVGAHSPFTTVLLQQLEVQGLEINELMRQVHDAVLANTNGRQEPAIFSSLGISPIYLVAPPSYQAEIAAWNAIQNSTDPVMFERFLKQFPESPLRPYAENKLRRLNASGRQETPAPSLSSRSPETADRAHERGDEAFKNRNYSNAIRWYQQAADGGNADAMFNLGSLHMMGLGVPVDYQAAMRWFRAAADRGDLRAMNQIAVLYGEGRGVPRDYAEALRWLHKAADGGEPTAMNNIGMAYKQGRGVPLDYAEAIRWFRRAADHGNSTSMVWLGFAYEYGHGVARDPIQARLWMEKAQKAGEEYAGTWLRDHPLDGTHH